MRKYPYTRNHQTGASLIEFAVALPALLLLGLGTLQGALAYHAKTTLNYAAFEAARKGAVTHAQTVPMREELGIRMAPIYGGDGSPEKALQAITRASLEAKDPRLTRIDILNPTVEAFADHGEDNPEAGVREIPNSHLRYRSREVKSASGVNIQDANLLKIKVTHGFKLKVPLIDRVVPAVLMRTDPTNAQFYSMRRIPITAVATVRMQSPAWPDNNWHAGGETGSGQVPPRPPEDNPNDPDHLAGDPTSGSGSGDADNGVLDLIDPDTSPVTCGIAFCCRSEEQLQVEQASSPLLSDNNTSPIDG